ncbi:hypothetical protein POSPLADRAFT_1165704 [Postia placenta MAD-698-R-SB12]|uniref:Uncharacterized protein n=1 Tax=Postia placenta MAD-698-R-SB12 TaxID=670580 RepID=A0A1X6NHR6_9APHY|nr:hypothetical protein POSPLADRAFT_1165704 [Postia placenta MAD-698-R-SB12]OSX68159.1 hypothetical protein POSPLADRAFT_1165704 [Postia placenta MAD-698-R-SB12]
MAPRSHSRASRARSLRKSNDATSSRQVIAPAAASQSDISFPGQSPFLTEDEIALKEEYADPVCDARTDLQQSTTSSARSPYRERTDTMVPIEHTATRSGKSSLSFEDKVIQPPRMERSNAAVPVLAHASADESNEEWEDEDEELMDSSEPHCTSARSPLADAGQSSNPFQSAPKPRARELQRTPSVYNFSASDAEVGDEFYYSADSVSVTVAPDDRFDAWLKTRLAMRDSNSDCAVIRAEEEQCLSKRFEVTIIPDQRRTIIWDRLPKAVYIWKATLLVKDNMQHFSRVVPDVPDHNIRIEWSKSVNQKGTTTARAENDAKRFAKYSKVFEGKTRARYCTNNKKPTEQAVDIQTDSKWIRQTDLGRAWTLRFQVPVPSELFAGCEYRKFCVEAKLSSIYEHGANSFTHTLGRDSEISIENLLSSDILKNTRHH